MLWVLSLLVAAHAPIEVALTFDDLPGRTVDLQNIAAALQQHQVPPTYGFVNGIQLEQSPERRRALVSWRAAGHLLGNHTYSHADLKTLPLATYLADIARNEPLLLALGGPWKVFRYPYLREGFDVPQRQVVRTYLREHGYRTAQVSLDTFDWSWDTAYTRCTSRADAAGQAQVSEAFLQETLAQLGFSVAAAQHLWGRPIKHILLAHARPLTAHVADRFLTAFESRGVRFISLDEALQDPVYALDPNIPEDGDIFPLQVMKARHDMAAPAYPEHSLARVRTFCPD